MLEAKDLFPIYDSLETRAGPSRHVYRPRCAYLNSLDRSSYISSQIISRSRAQPEDRGRRPGSPREQYFSFRSADCALARTWRIFTLRRHRAHHIPAIAGLRSELTEGLKAGL